MRILVIILLLVMLQACSDNKSISPGNEITKKITIDFEFSKNRNDDWLEFEMRKSSELSVKVSKGTIKNEIFRITEEEYNQDNKPIIITITSEKEGEYFFDFKFRGASKGIAHNFEIGEGISIQQIKVEAVLRRHIVIIIIAIVIILLSLLSLLLKMKREREFDGGYLDISFPRNEQIELEGKSKIDLAKEYGLEDILCNISCEINYRDFEGEEIKEKQPHLEVDTDMYIVDIDNTGDRVTSKFLNVYDDIIILNSQKEVKIKFLYKKN